MKTKSLKKFKPVYKTGGAFKANAGLTGGTEAAAAITTPIVDMIDNGNSYGRQTGLASGLKMGSQFAAAGAALGPVGAIAGGVLGLGAGLIGSIGAKKKENAMDRASADIASRESLAKGNARIAADPSLMYGDQNNQMFALGGSLKEDPKLKATADSLAYKNMKLKTPIKTSAFGPNWDGLVEKKDLTIGMWGNPLQGNTPRLIPTPVIPTAHTDHKGNLSGQKYQGSPATTKLIEERERQLRARSKRFENGGPLQQGLEKNNQLEPLNHQAVEVQGPSHEQGGVQIPGAEVEGGETISKGFVFSEELGFSKLHKPIAKAIGKIEAKPLTAMRKRTLKALEKNEQELAIAQETFKSQLGIQ